MKVREYLPDQLGYTSIRMAKKIWGNRISACSCEDCIAVRSLFRRINQQKKLIRKLSFYSDDPIENLKIEIAIAHIKRGASMKFDDIKIDVFPPES